MLFVLLKLISCFVCPFITLYIWLLVFYLLCLVFLMSCLYLPFGPIESIGLWLIRWMLSSMSWCWVELMLMMPFLFSSTFSCDWIMFEWLNEIPNETLTKCNLTLTMFAIELSEWISEFLWMECEFLWMIILVFLKFLFWYYVVLWYLVMRYLVLMWFCGKSKSKADLDDALSSLVKVKLNIKFIYLFSLLYMIYLLISSLFLLNNLMIILFHDDNNLLNLTEWTRMNPRKLILMLTLHWISYDCSLLHFLKMMNDISFKKTKTLNNLVFSFMVL